jgi:uncharacterized membrane protein YphA (DoxX/SURF4 family)
MKRNTAIEIISSLLILLFVYTAISKLLDYASFKSVLSRSPFISSVAPLVAWALPAVEILISVLLLIPKTRLWGLYSSAIVMLLFTIYIGGMMAFAPHLPCSCGGVIRQMNWTQHLVFNICFTLLSLAGIWLAKKKKSRKYEIEPPPVVFT